VAQQAAQILGGTFEKAFDLGKEGAAIIQTGESFDLLLEKIGAGKYERNPNRKGHRAGKRSKSTGSAPRTL